MCEGVVRACEGVMTDRGGVCVITVVRECEGISQVLCCYHGNYPPSIRTT